MTSAISHSARRKRTSPNTSALHAKIHLPLLSALRAQRSGFYIQGNRTPYGRLGGTGRITALGCIVDLVRLVIAVVLVLLSVLAVCEMTAGKSFAMADLRFVAICWVVFFAVLALWRRLRL